MRAEALVWLKLNNFVWHEINEGAPRSFLADNLLIVRSITLCQITRLYTHEGEGAFFRLTKAPCIYQRHDVLGNIRITINFNQRRAREIYEDNSTFQQKMDWDTF